MPPLWPDALKTRFVGATLIDGTGGAVRLGATVEISGGRISGVWPGPAPSAAEDNTETVDAAGLTLLPGLIDGHAHLVLEPDVAAPEDWDRALLDDDATLLLRGTVAAGRLIVAGVTTVRDCGGRGSLSLRIRDAVAQGKILGPRILASGAVITRTGGHGHRFGIAADDVSALQRAAEQLLDDGVDFLKIMATGGNLTPGTRPDVPQYSAAELAVVAREAHRRGRRVTAHAHAHAGIQNVVDAGIDSIEHCSWMGRDGRAYDPLLVDRMTANGVFVDFTPAVSYRMVEDHDPAWSELRQRLRRVRETRVPTMAPMWKAGVQFYFGSDAGTPLTFFEDFALVLELSVLEGGLPAEVVIAAATGTAARALGIEGDTGTIAAGKAADLLLIEGDPLRDIRALRQVRRVYRGGRLVVDHGNLVVSRPGLAYVPPAASVTPFA